MSVKLPYHVVCLYSLEQFPMLAPLFLWDRSAPKSLCGYFLLLLGCKCLCRCIKLWLLFCNDKNRKNVHTVHILYERNTCTVHRYGCQMSYLEVVVLVDGASGVRGHISHGRQIHVLAGEQEEIHTAALRHTLFRQLLIHSFLRLEQGLRKTKRISFG